MEEFGCHPEGGREALEVLSVCVCLHSGFAGVLRSAHAMPSSHFSLSQFSPVLFPWKPVKRR